LADEIRDDPVSMIGEVTNIREDINIRPKGIDRRIGIMEWYAGIFTKSLH
jgi:hypothetical protein